MDILAFIASILSSLAWPITVIALAFLFRKSLAKILESIKLKKIKRGDLEFDFDQELTQLKSKVEAVPIQSATRPVLPETTKNLPKQLMLPMDNQLEMISQINPASGIALAWSNVEQGIQDSIVRLAISPDYPGYNSALRNIQLLIENKVIDASFAETLNALRQLRNQAVHELSDSDSGLTIKEAENYILLAKKAVDILSSLERKKK